MKRYDSRQYDQLRKIQIERNVIKYAEGSCLIKIGDTEVICTATIEKNVPQFLKGANSGWVTSEYRMLPRATQTRNVRDRISGRTMEIQRLIGRALRSVVDLKLLGERTIWIDCDVIQADGGTRTASTIGGFIALVDCISTLRQPESLSKFPICDFLGATSVGIWRGNYMLDLTYQEDVEVDVDMNIVMKGNGEFVEVQGTAEGKAFSQKDLDKLIRLAKKGIDEIIDLERNLFKDLLPDR